MGRCFAQGRLSVFIFVDHMVHNMAYLGNCNDSRISYHESVGKGSYFLLGSIYIGFFFSAERVSVGKGVHWKGSPLKMIFVGKLFL